MTKATLMFCVVISMAMTGFGQQTVTNATLEKFQQKRLAAERDYRENYRRMGFPSPEELERQRQSDMTARLELAKQLRQTRLQKERLELEQRRLDLEAVRNENESETEIDTAEYPTFYGYGGTHIIGISSVGGFGYGHRYRRYRPRSPFGGFGFGNRRFVSPPSGYRATPFQVIPVPNTRPARILRGGRRF